MNYIYLLRSVSGTGFPGFLSIWTSFTCLTRRCKLGNGAIPVFLTLRHPLH